MQLTNIIKAIALLGASMPVQAWNRIDKDNAVCNLPLQSKESELPYRG
jgi:hypothetical protein